MLDTNAVIYLQKGLLADSLPPGEYLISVITEIELLSFAGLNEAQRDWLQRLIDDLQVVESTAPSNKTLSHCAAIIA